MTFDVATQHLRQLAREIGEFQSMHLRAGEKKPPDKSGGFLI